MSIVDQVREWFTLAELEARVAQGDEGVRLSASRALALSEQRRRAAEAVWIAGVPAEGLRLAAEAAALARRAGEPSARDGVDPDAIRPDVAIEDGLPTFDEEVTAAHAERYLALLDEQARARAAREALRLDVAAVRARRGSRIAATLGVVAFALAGLVVALRKPPHLEATASARFDGRFEPQNAIDGNEKTDWLLPDRATGMLDVKVLPARKVARVRVMNARNLPFADRASKEVLIEALEGGRVVKAGGAQFEASSADPTWRDLDLGVKVDAVRVTVKSWHGLGGGVAEVVVE